MSAPSQRHSVIEQRGPQTAVSLIASLSLAILMLLPMACAPQPSGDRSSATLTTASHTQSQPIPPPAPAPAPSVEASSTAAPPPAVEGDAHDAAVREVASIELGPDVAATMPALPPSPPPVPADPGAAAIVHSINGALSHRDASAEGVTIISVRDLRNLSRVNADEFNRMRRRLCEVLTRAGAEQKLVFIDSENPAIAPHYRLLGSAYVVTADGFDQWEMYLSLTPAARDFQVWDARGAVRMLRLPRAGQPQITYLGK